MRTNHSKVMKSPKKLTCFSRPSRGKGGEVGGVEMCRQGHAIWLGEHYELEQFNRFIKEKQSQKFKPMAVLAAKRLSRETKKASKAANSSSCVSSMFLVPGSAPSSSPGDAASSTSPGAAAVTSSPDESATSSNPGDAASSTSPQELTSTSSSPADSASWSSSGDFASSSCPGDEASTKTPGIW